MNFKRTVTRDANTWSTAINIVIRNKVKPAILIPLLKMKNRNDSTAVNNATYIESNPKPTEATLSSFTS